jgi:hypothetical protein
MGKHQGESGISIAMSEKMGAVIWIIITRFTIGMKCSPGRFPKNPGIVVPGFS